MRILLTGQNGYLGKKVIKSLDSQKYEITFWDNQMIYQRSIKEFDTVINLVGRYERIGVQRKEIIESNCLFGLRLLDFAIENEISNFLTIDTSLPDDFNVYSFSKKQFKDWGEFFANKQLINFADVSLQMFYGYDEPPERFWVWCANKLMKNEDISLTQGTQLRDIVYIDDVVEALIFIINNQPNGFSHFQVGAGMAPSLKESVEYLKIISKSKSQLLWGDKETRINEPDCISDLSSLKEIGWEPKYTWTQGLDRFWHEYKINHQR